MSNSKLTPEGFEVTVGSVHVTGDKAEILDDYCEIDGVGFWDRQATVAMDLVKERDALNQQIDRLYQRIPHCLMLCIDLINELTPEKRHPFQNRLNKVWPTPKGEQTDE